jgi:hypothetical protein
MLRRLPKQSTQLFAPCQVHFSSNGRLFRLAKIDTYPTFSSTIAYTRLTAAAAIAHLESEGFGPAQLPSPSTMSLVLNRMGYRLRKVLKAKPKKSA